MKSLDRLLLKLPQASSRTRVLATPARARHTSATRRLTRAALRQVGTTFTACRKRFEEADADKDGTVSLQEFQAIAASQALSLQADTLRALYQEADLDSSKGLDFHEVLVLLCLVWVFETAAGEAPRAGEAVGPPAPAAAPELAELDKAMATLVDFFRFFDKENRGWLTREDVAAALDGGGARSSNTSSHSGSVSRSDSNMSSSPGMGRRFSFRQNEGPAPAIESAAGNIQQRLREMDYSRDGRVTFPEFVLAVEGWAGADDDDEEEAEAKPAAPAAAPVKSGAQRAAEAALDC